MLGQHPQRGAARHEQVKFGRLAQQLGHVCACLRQVLEIVEQEEKLLVTKIVRERPRERLGA